MKKEKVKSDNGIVSLPLSAVKPYAKNPRNNEEAIDHVARSIQRYGFQSPIIIDREKVIICGHTRYYAAQKIGLESVPCRYGKVGSRYLSESEAKGLRIADNKTSEYAKWDKAFLSLELQDLEKALPSESLSSLTAFSEAEILALLRNVDEDDESAAAGKIPVETKITIGDAFRLGDHRLLCGDSLSRDTVDLFFNGKKADMCFTDPPYGVNYSGGIQFTADGVVSDNRDRLENDDSDVYPKAIAIISEYTDGPAYTFFPNKRAGNIYAAIDAADGDIRSLLVWKKNGGYAAMSAHYKEKHEPFLYWIPKGAGAKWSGLTTETTVVEVSKDGKNQFHPTQKPIELVARILGNHSARTVFDPFGGSGSTLIAAEKLGRACHTIEIDPMYCQTIINRWEAYTGKTAVSDGALAISESKK